MSPEEALNILEDGGIKVVKGTIHIPEDYTPKEGDAIDCLINEWDYGSYDRGDL